MSEKMNNEDLLDIAAHQSSDSPMWDLMEGGKMIEAHKLTHLCPEDRVVWIDHEHASKHIVSDGNLYYEISQPAPYSVGHATVVGRYWDSKSHIEVPALISVDKQAYRVTAIGDEAFSTHRGQQFVTALRTVTLSFNIYSIGKKAFAGNQNTLEMIDIPEDCNVDDTAFDL